MFRSSLVFAVLTTTVLGTACKKGDDDGSTTGPGVEKSGLNRFYGVWNGTANRDDGQSFPSEARFNYDKELDEISGTVDLDAFWLVTMGLGAGGSYVLDGLPIVENNPSTLVWTDVEFDDDTYSSFKANWLWDYVDGTYQGSVSYTKTPQ